MVQLIKSSTFLLLLFISSLSFAQNRPNIILIMADDLGFGELSYTNDWGSTPIIDSLCRNGAFLEQYYASTICTTTRVQILSGKYAYKQAMDVSVIWPFENRGISQDLKLLPELLKEYGYQTALFGKWHLGHSRPEQLPMNNGFDFFRGFLTGGIYYYSKLSTKGGFDYQENGRLLPDNSDYMTEDIGQNAKAWISYQLRDTSIPFFVYIPFHTPHDPYEAPQTYIDQAPVGYSSNSKKLWAMNKVMDDQIGEIWQTVRDAGQEENTIIIFCSDNGDHPVGSNFPFSGFKASTYEGSIRAPFVWYHKGSVEHRDITGTTSVLDIYKTISESILNSPQTDTLDGMNLYSAIYEGESIDTSRILITKFCPDRNWSVHKGRWKLVNNKAVSVHSSAVLTDDVELFDVVSDPGETTDVFSNYPAIVAELRAAIDTAQFYYPTPNTWVEPKPVGWTNFFGYGYPEMFYSPDYYYYE